MKPPLFEGTASTRDYAEHLATGTLGKVIGSRSDGAIRYSKQDCWCKFEWAEGPSEVSAPGLPTVSLPKKFRIVEAEDPKQDKDELSSEDELSFRLSAIKAHVQFVGDDAISPKTKQAVIDMCLGWKPGTKRGVKLI